MARDSWLGRLAGHPRRAHGRATLLAHPNGPSGTPGTRRRARTGPPSTAPRASDWDASASLGGGLVRLQALLAESHHAPPQLLRLQALLAESRSRLCALMGLCP